MEDDSWVNKNHWIDAFAIHYWEIIVYKKLKYFKWGFWIYEKNEKD